MEAQTKTKSKQLRVQVIGLGGTISLQLEGGRAVSSNNLDQVITETDIDTDALHVSGFSMMTKDSVDLTLTDLIDVANHIDGAAKDFDSFIVTTGTDTLEELAYGLHLLLGNRCRVVVTGAMRPPYMPDYDGHSNLCDAFTLCQIMRPDQAGVIVAMGGYALAAEFALKDSVSRLDAFVSTSDSHPAHPISRSTELKMLPQCRSERSKPDIDPTNLPTVDIVGVSIGSRLSLNTKHLPDGLVCACPGSHSVSAQLIEDLKPMFEAGRPVVLASRCARSLGPMERHYPGYLDVLENRGLTIKSYEGLSPQKARIKLAILLASAE